MNLNNRILHPLGFFAILTLLYAGVPGLCFSESTAPVCGNGVIEPNEACDDGNLMDGDGCSSLCTVEEQCYDEGNAFSFFTFSDSNTGSGEDGVIRVMTDAVNRGKYPSRIIPRFWIATGDIPFMANGTGILDQLNDSVSNSSSGQYYPFACSAGNGKFPYFVALGNHDVDGYVNMTPQTQYSYWNNFVGPRLPSTLVGIRNFRWGPDNGYDARTTYSFDYKNSHFIVVNQYHGDSTYPTVDPKGCIRQDLLDWIDQDLVQTDRPVRFVFGHEPAWSYCSTTPGCGGDYCPGGYVDNQNPPRRPRPYSTTGSWLESFGRHWGDSLEDPACPVGSREAFWSLLARHKVVAHFVGHTHTYGSRLVRGDGTPRNDISAYNKAGASFDSSEGVWEVNNSETHNSAGSGYVLTTVRNNVVTFEAYDQIGTAEPLKPIESWAVRLGSSVELTSPLEGATFTEPAEIALAAAVHDPGGTITQVDFYANSSLIGTAATGPFTFTWSAVPTGKYRLSAVAADSTGNAITSNSVNITVYLPPGSGNLPPDLAPIGDKIVLERTLLTFTASATDLNGTDVLTFSLDNPPAGAVIGASSGVFTWTPTSAQIGTHTFTVRVTDNGNPPLSDSETITITVNSNVDLVMKSISTTKTLVAPGTSLTVSNSAGNKGGASSGTFVIGFHLSQDGVYGGADDIAFTQTRSVSSLNAGGSSSSSTTVTTPALALPGNYYLCASADINNTISEIDETNNGLCTTATIRVDYPDLILTQVQPVASTVSPGGKLSVADTLKNQGTVPAGSSKIAYRLSINRIYGDEDDLIISTSRTVASLGAGASNQATTSLTIPTTINPGGYFLCASADSANSILETDETNNTRCSDSLVTVQPLSPPDLTMTGLSTTAISVVRGGRLTLSNTVANQGGAVATSFTIAFHLSPDAIYGGNGDIAFSGGRSVFSLNGGASSTASTSLTVPSTTPTGYYYLCATADSGSTVTEGDETNNARCTGGTIRVY
jgi:cysteine-rich repeat protein